MSTMQYLILKLSSDYYSKKGRTKDLEMFWFDNDQYIVLAESRDDAEVIYELATTKPL